MAGGMREGLEMAEALSSTSSSCNEVYKFPTEEKNTQSQISLSLSINSASTDVHDAPPCWTLKAKTISPWHELETLADCPDNKREELLRRKLQLCSTVYDFSVPSKRREKMEKRGTIKEIIAYVLSKPSLKESSVQAMIDMIASNIFRALVVKERSPFDALDPDEPELVPDKTWYHLEVVYELLLNLIKEVESKIAARVLTRGFIVKLLDLLESDDTRERDALKLILRSIYSRLQPLRRFLRQVMQNACLKVIYENEMQNGMSEILDILRSIISAFQPPMRSEHHYLLQKVLLPLHKVRSLPYFHFGLQQCIVLYIGKDAGVLCSIVNALLLLWPNSMSAKEALFLEELEQILALATHSQFLLFQEQLLRRLALCISSTSSLVAERALGFWRNEQIVALFDKHRDLIYPVILRALYTNVRQHWQSFVHTRNYEVLRIFVDADKDLFDIASAENRRRAADIERKDAIREKRWQTLQDMFNKKHGVKPTTEGVKALQKNDSVKIGDSSYRMAVTWNHACPGTPPEIELQTLVVSQDGTIVDVACSNKEHACGQALRFQFTQMAEATPLTKAGCYCSAVSVSIPNLPPKAQLLLFVVSEFSQGGFRAASHAVFHVLQEPGLNRVAQFSIDHRHSGLGIVALMKRPLQKPTPWSLERLGVFPRAGQHFMDVLEPDIGHIVRSIIPSAPKRQKVRLDVERGDIVEMPCSQLLKQAFVSIGWDLSRKGLKNVAAKDQAHGLLDVFAALFDVDGKQVVTVSAKSPESPGVHCRGIGVTSGGFFFDLMAIPRGVSQIFFAAIPKSQDFAVELIQELSCVVLDRTGAELGRYEHRDVDGGTAGFLSSRLFRKSGSSRYSFQGLGCCVAGFRSEDMLDAMQQLCHASPDGESLDNLTASLTECSSAMSSAGLSQDDRVLPVRLRRTVSL
mmetsp:Transcript_19411/g.42391  ORF Transcript_19411/g.42391 Transcript_19411/m.42391 type:complete len:919 (+) Transcript_19411:13-2769(+)